MTLIKSWIESANSASTDFPVNNLPLGVFSFAGKSPRCGCAIGNMVVDLSALEAAGLLDGLHGFDQPALNAFMEQGPANWAKFRSRLTDLLRVGGDNALSSNDELRASAMLPMDKVVMHMPIKVAEYTDFYANKNHAVNVGTMFRGAENALPPNWLHIPIGYNGRASTVVVSGTNIIRPNGQTKAPDAKVPKFGPCQRLDFELEMGAIIGTPSEMGKPVSLVEAEEMIFGYVLLNDWSARDIQAWEYQPLGPFQAKAFATSISPWVVMKAALETFRVPTPKREKPLLPYLEEGGDTLYDIDLTVSLKTTAKGAAEIITQTNYREMYYSSVQQLTHHASSGCAMNVGDLLGSGTISGTEKTSYGSLLELSWGGKEPIKLADGETRTFLQDGDVLTMSGHAKGNGYRTGFGQCEGKILPAMQL